MILDRLENRHLYAGEPRLAAVLAALDAVSAPGDSIDLPGGAGRVGVAEFVTREPGSYDYEAHRLHADVHVVLAGRERVDIAHLADLSVTTPYDEASDVGFLAGEALVSVVLRPGWFLVVYPQDAHRPGQWVDGPEPIVKAVGKVRVA